MADQLVPAVSTRTGEHRRIPANWLEESGPFPGQWRLEEEPTPAPSPTPTPRKASKPSEED